MSKNFRWYREAVGFPPSVCQSNSVSPAHWEWVVETEGATVARSHEYKRVGSKACDSVEVWTLQSMQYAAICTLSIRH